MSDNTIPDASKCPLMFLGKTGLKVSNICLGAMTFGKSYGGFLHGNIDEEESHQLMDRFAAWGGNFIDTADVYGPKVSETIVGNWLQKQERERFVIATKVRFHVDRSNPNKVGLSRRHITRAVEESLGRLQTDFIDLYQTHLWDNAVPLEETLRTLNDLVRCGKVRYLGACNLSGWQLQKWIQVQEKLGLEPVVALQQHYSLKERASEWEAFQVCKGNGLGVLPWSPLNGGVLAGKVSRDKAPETGRLSDAVQKNFDINAAPNWNKFKDKEQVWNILDVSKRIAEKHGKTQAKVAIRWLLQKDIVASVIIGARTLQQLDDNMGAANGWTLTPEEFQMAELDKVSQPDKPYPYSMADMFMGDRVNPFNPSCNL
ncbi:uncharacterized protein LOC112574866 isoform X1 [Pomacea canaliculata]|uniref:uncharacterized protein LOC112574866 isoform X1 n=1 Tax=Pomacea canaliculata TaxID=400727 RepID=UPI000D72976E|nr:uncharacterized protein LOC112574866 isoform X1 [Pomacea canaliculata]XP_025111969.1 uncharacterized protein LOC112574866 isoform X1 [Pomacea canaliculata]